MRQTKWEITYGNGHIARFSEFEAACRFAREESRPNRTSEVRSRDGLVAQFACGLLTPEFLHLAPRFPEFRAALRAANLAGGPGQ